MPATKDSEKKIEALREKIRYHEYLYYVIDNPEISDAEFDRLMNELKKLDVENARLCQPSRSRHVAIVFASTSCSASSRRPIRTSGRPNHIFGPCGSPLPQP